LSQGIFSECGWMYAMFDDAKANSPFISFLMTLALIGIFTHYASTCNSIKRRSRYSAENDSEKRPQFRRCCDESSGPVVLAPPGDSLLEDKPT
ncbi:hypothetical protein V3C99_008286, partial [Haemonchus contortus]|uniref:Pecanex-like protein n=1 Tax=Haemonchus contortus TaxID=6289 RepID=A0A7I4Z6Y2_HAECO